MRHKHRLLPSPRRAFALLVVPALVVSACASDGEDASDRSTPPEGTSVAVFDASVVHQVSLSFDQAAYDAMIETFTETGEKEWVEVTVTIDGDTYQQAGIRLKGNSSLAGLGGGFGPGFGFPGQDADDESGETTSTTDTTASSTATTETTTTGADDDAEGGGPGFGPSGSADADAPEGLPWLIRLDQFVDGQDHQGYEELVVRSNGSETSLNEAVALDLLDEAGLASQEAVATSFTVNDGEPALRLIIEHPSDDAWYEEAFEGDGALYKAESTGDWSYRGDDPAEYEEVFDQEGGSDVTDLTPLIDLLQFIDEADDETFAAELPDHLDVESFATYLAMMDLVDNFDDIDGPGNNAYLWYDVATEQFTVVPWDLNLAFGGLGFALGGGDGPPGFPQGGRPPTDMSLPEGFEPPEGFDPSNLPDGLELPEGFDPSNLPDLAGGAPGGFGGSNELVQRFHATPGLEELYQQALVDLRASLYESGTADEILAARVKTLTDHASDLVDSETIASEAEAIASQFTEGD